VLSKIYRKTWLLKPLTRQPHHPQAVVSDLFVWRNSRDWQTVFEMCNLAALFPGETLGKNAKAHFTFFDPHGNLFLETTIQVSPYQRQTLELAPFLSHCKDEYGTFACFHEVSPSLVRESASFLAERGYTGYRFGHSSVLSYTHGNLDAIARLPGQQLQLLGQAGIRQREYCLQHVLQNSFDYEFGLVNPTERKQRVSLQVFLSQNITRTVETGFIPPRGIHIFSVNISAEETARVMFKSQLVMARPLVFCTTGSSSNIFHG
jgi:hypothetical protein